MSDSESSAEALRVTGIDCLRTASKDSGDDDEPHPSAADAGDDDDDHKAADASDDLAADAQHDTGMDSSLDEEIASLPLEIRNGPHMTDAVHQLEFNYASEDERARAQADMYGLPPAGSAYGDQVLAERAAASVEAALNKIPPAERVAQLKAQIAHPFLLSCPRDVLPFLEAEDRDVPAAARRIVRYWAGQERLLGEEAFSKESFAQYPLTDEDRGRLYSRGFQSTPDAKVNDALRAAVVKALSSWLLEKIEALEREIEALPPPKQKAALIEAKERDREVLEEGRVIEFLESEEYNAQKAAERMASYWDMKTYLFGKDDALRDDAYLLQSIQDDCRRELELDIFYVLPGYDKYGRGIVVLRADKTPEDREAQLRLLKVFWFVMANLMAKSSARRHGVVFLCYIGNLMNTQANNLEFLTRWAQLNFHCIPLRTCAFHDCIPPRGRWFRNLFLPFLMWIIQRSARMRFIVHDEEPEAMPEILASYGIKKEQLPSVIGGTLDEDYPRQWTEDNLRELEPVDDESDDESGGGGGDGGGDEGKEVGGELEEEEKSSGITQ